MQIPIYIESTGNGPVGRPDLVLIHGWGLHGAVWQEVASRLASDFTVHCVDLPGHGNSPLLEEQYDLENVATAVASALSLVTSNRIHVLGWSFGGMVATQMALNSAQWIDKLVLVATNLQFTQSEDWPCAMEYEVLDGFADMLEDDYDKTLDRFFALQLLGMPQAKQILSQLKQRLADKRQPDIRALRGGLDILADSDLRSAAQALTQPVQLLMGDKDKLVPIEAAAAMAKLIPDTEVITFPKTGHAPFLTHPDQFIDAVKLHLTS